MTAEAFLDQLRGQRQAVCTLQASARGQAQRLRYRIQQTVRREAAQRIQNSGRRRLAVRIADAARLQLRLARARTLRERHSARRLQRAWRWRRNRRTWRAAWAQAAAARAKREDQLWRKRLRSGQARRSTSPTGFSEYSTYVESKQSQEAREAQLCAACAMQAGWRGSVARRESSWVLHALGVLQAGARGWRARERARWHRALRRHRAARRVRLRWVTHRATLRALMPVQTHAVLAQLHVHKESEVVRREAARERQEFEASFKRWAKGMQKHMLAKKLHADWIPQMNSANGESYYFNLRTGESSEEHPNMRQIRSLERKQRALAEQRLAVRLTRLRNYVQGMEAVLTDQLAQYRTLALAQARRQTTDRASKEAALRLRM